MLMTMLIIQDASSLSGGGEKRGEEGSQPAQFRMHLSQRQNWPYFKLHGL